MIKVCLINSGLNVQLNILLQEYARLENLILRVIDPQDEEDSLLSDYYDEGEIAEEINFLSQQIHTELGFYPTEIGWYSRPSYKADDDEIPF